ncbi:MAG: hypothetical protein K2Q18_15820 [Bdellovibrionales bacterium]|nr:hypothetical protein [Bdellovibrionales bacterium]
MNALKSFSISGVQLTRIKLALLVTFTMLMLLQLLIGFQSFEDYLIALVYLLFLNDLYIKVKKPDFNSPSDERSKRLVMSVFFLLLFAFSFALEAFNVTDGVRAFFYRLGFILWAQVFLLDAFANYRQTQSKKWLIITNMAVIFIVMGALIS